MFFVSDKFIVCFRALDGNDVNDKAELQKETNKVISVFAEICDGLYKFVKSNRGNAEELRWIIQSWIHCGTIEKNDRFQDLSKDALEDIEDTRKLWRIFSSFSSFFNFKLVERAINVLDFEKGKVMMENYKVIFNDYLKRRVTHCPSNVGMTGSDHIVLLVKLDKAYANCRMEHLKLLGEDISKLIHVDSDKLFLDSVNQGCICVTFHLHDSAVATTFFLTEKQVDNLKCLRYGDARILNIQCENVLYIIGEFCCQEAKLCLSLENYFIVLFIE